MRYDRKRKLKMYSENPNCIYCGRKTVIYPHKEHFTWPDDEATIEHFFGRLEKERYENNGSRQNTFLCCRKCNQEKQLEKMKKINAF